MNTKIVTSSALVSATKSIKDAVDNDRSEINRLKYDVKSINRYSRRNIWNKRAVHHSKRKWDR